MSINRNFRLPLSSLLLISLLPSIPAIAATIYVDAASMTGIEDGSRSNPYDTVGEALAVAAGGDTVSVAPGIYYGSMRLPDVPVSVVSEEGPAVTILDGQGSTRALVDAANPPYGIDVTFEGFTMANAYYGAFAWSPWQTGNRPTVTLRNCILRNLGTGVRASISSEVTVENTVIVDTRDALQVIWGRSATFRNLTIDRAERAIWSYQFPAPQLFNTTISNVDIAFSLNYFVSLSGSHNNVWNYGSLEQTSGNPGTLSIADTLSVDPVFVAAPDDYRLDPDSPLIDAGIDVGLPFAGEAPDVGAYEFTEFPLREQVEQLAASFATAPTEFYREPGEQRAHALYLKLMAVTDMIATRDRGQSDDEKVRALNGALNKLEGDILAKVDGGHGGNPANDWIDDPAEKSEFYERVLDLIDFLRAEIETITAGLQ